MDEGFQSSAFAQSINDRNRSSRSLEMDFGADIESGIALSADFNEFDSLKTFLDSNRDTMKLDSMRRIIKMVARGRDCAELFPAVVKNVVSKDPEIRKLVYIYLTRYAEEQQDTALLSVSTFQRSLKDPNQLIRASALRVLCSIRIPILVPIMMLAINDASKDLSPYVRKTAAHAVLKVYSLEPREKGQLIEVIERLLADKTTLVVGSAVRAFEEVCPERLELIHRNYRKLCSLLMDVDEWGQVFLMNMLTRYARTQFPDPERKVATGGNTQEEKETDLLSPSPTHVKDVPSAGAGDEHGSVNITTSSDYSMVDALPLLEADYNSLVDSCRFLLQSRNTAVVMAAGQLLFALKSKEDYPAVAKALVRSLHGPMEVQYVLLINIATLSINHPGLFEPYLRSFYCFTNDPLYIKLVKLDILSNLATETSCPTILREFQYYVTQPDPKFVTATIQAIGRCASAVPQIMNICLNGLVRLMSRPDEKIVAECILVLRKLLQMQNSDHKEIIVRIAQLTDTMTVPSALASILWLLGEYSSRVPKIAPDILRKMAKTFVTQESVVKLQILNLAAKLAIVNPKQTHLLAQYVFTLARYDQSYDIRDRSRLLRALIFPQLLNETGPGNSAAANTVESKGPALGYLARHARKICLAAKPAPVTQSLSKERSNFTLGSLSHLLNRCVPGYRELPDWPAIPPNPWSRVVQSTDTPVVSSGSPPSSVLDQKSNSRANHLKSLRDFFSDSESEEDDEEEEEEEEEGEGDEELEVEGMPEKAVYEDEQDEKEEEGDKNEKERNGDDDLISGDSQNGTCSARKTVERAEQRSRVWDDEQSSEEIQSDLVELGAESVGSSSDSEFALGPLEKLLPSNKPNHSSDTPGRGSTDAAITSPGTTVTTEPSDSEERTFSSSALVTTKVTSVTHSLLKASLSGDTETESDDDEDEKNEEVQYAGDHLVSKEVKPDISRSPKNIPPGQNLPPPPCALRPSLNTKEGFNSCPPIVADREGSVSEVSGTSSVTLPALTSSNPSVCESQKMSTISESPSVAIEPSLIPNVIDTTPTPLPTWDRGLSEAGELKQCASLTTCWKSRDALRWFELPKAKDSYLTLRYQFNRIVCNHNANLVTLLLELTVRDHVNSPLMDIHLDLGSSVMGRLLLDANRIEAFAPIEHLYSGSTELRTISIDFAGFTDPVEINLMYTMNQGTQDGSVFTVPLLIAPPPGELIRPNHNSLVNDQQYVDLRDKLAKSQCISHSPRIHFAPNSPQPFDPSALIALVLQTANMHFLGITMCFGSLSTSEPSLLLRFSSSTIAENELCLVELQLTGSHWCSLPGISTSDIISPLEITEPETMEALTGKSLVNNEARFVVLCSAPRIRIALCTELDAVLRDNIALSTDCTC